MCGSILLPVLNIPNMRRCRSLWLTFLFLLLLGPLRADDVKTVAKKFPIVTSAAPVLPKKLKYDAMLNRWGMGAWWSRREYSAIGRGMVRIGSGFEMALATPEFLAALTNDDAKSKLLNDTEAQALYEQNLSKYTGGKLAFMGYIQLDTIADMDADWTFYLFTSDGKRLKPDSVDIGPVEIQHNSVSGGSYARREVSVIFANKDPDSGKSLLNLGTTSLTLAMAGYPGQIKARFEFDPKKSKDSLSD